MVAEVLAGRRPGVRICARGSTRRRLGGRAASVLADGVDRVRHAAPGLDVASVLERGTPVEVLLRQADDAAMVVVGSRGLGGFTGLLVGSTSVQVAGHAGCPVVVVRAREAAAEPGPEAGRVVVGVDGSASADAALGFVFEQAAVRGVGLTAVLSLAIQGGGGGPGDVGPTVLDVLMTDADFGATILDETITVPAEVPGGRRPPARRRPTCRSGPRRSLGRCSPARRELTRTRPSAIAGPRIGQPRRPPPRPCAGRGHPPPALTGIRTGPQAQGCVPHRREVAR